MKNKNKNRRTTPARATGAESMVKKTTAPASALGAEAMMKNETTTMAPPPRRRRMLLPPRSRLTLALVLAVAGLIAILAGNAFGLWWITMIVGFVIGVLVRGAVVSLPAAGLAGVLGWGLALAWQALFVPINSAATVVAGIMFGSANGALTIILTLLLALLLSLVGVWAGAALRRLVLPSTPGPL